MASKSKRRRKVLGASCILAALIIAGSSFAWFTSKDEVTNRLSATANYGVTIAEDFTPPENWIPGQEIKKNVGIVNTGNVDAFARTWLTGEMRIVSETPVASLAITNTGVIKSSDGTFADGVTDTTDDDLKALNLNKVYTDGSGNKSYLKELDKTTVINNPLINNTSTDDANDYTEVQAVQAGGYLAYCPTGAEYMYTLNNAKTMTILTSSGTELKNVSGDIYAGAYNASKTSVAVGTVGDIDSDTFKPKTTGLYLFRRNVDYEGATGSVDDYEFSGYYYVAGSGYGDGKYYALTCDSNNISDNTIPKSSYTLTRPTEGTVTVTPGDVTLFTAKENVVKNTDLKWVYTAPGSGQTTGTLKAYYGGADGVIGWDEKSSSTAGYTKMDDVDKYYKDCSADDIIITVNLNNIKTPSSGDAENWTVLSTTGNTDTIITAVDFTGKTTTTIAANDINQKWTFYYNNDIEEGATTERFVDSVVLDSSVTQHAYLAFDFDLNVNMDSIQVTLDSTGKEEYKTVEGGWTSTDTNVTAGKASAVKGDPEIESITWQKNA